MFSDSTIRGQEGPNRRAAEAVLRCEFWRAKEILQGAVSGRFDPAEFEQLGQVLLAMGDKLEAGKYLFLSGTRRPEYAESIQLFLERFGRSDPKRLPQTFPRVARLERSEDYPLEVSIKLAELGITTGTLTNTAKRKNRIRQSKWVTVSGCAAVILLLLLASIGLVWLLGML
jgi:hypothetical protein